MKKIDSLQVLRAFAALLVFVFHFTSYYQTITSRDLGLLKFGYLGVDIFFVLSGFVVVYSSMQLQGVKQSAVFFVRRIARIYLGYWPFLILGIWMTFHFNSPKLTFTNIYSSLLLINADPSFLIVGIAWSLVFELFFYSVFSVLLLFKNKFRFVALVILGLFILAWNIYWQCFAPELVATGSNPGHFYLSSLSLEFLSGCFLAYAYPKFLNFSRKVSLGFFGISLVCGILFLVAAICDDRIRLNGIFRALYLGGFATMSVLCMLLIHLVFRPKYFDWLIGLGEASYALYLLHGFALDFFSISRIYQNFLKNIFVFDLFCVLYILATLIVSYYYCRLFELPIYRAFVSWLKRQQWAS